MPLERWVAGRGAAQQALRHTAGGRKRGMMLVLSIS